MRDGGIRVNAYQFQMAGKIVAGCGTLERLAEHAAALPPARKALVLSQPSMVKAGHVDTVVRQLRQLGVESVCSLEIKPEPTIHNLNEVYSRYKEERCDWIVGLGGGSVLDAAKILSVLPTNAAPLEEMLGVDRVASAGLPTILIPTTSGTGSEATPNAIVTVPEQELKIGVVSRHLLPKLVILDAQLTIGLPKPITAATGMDAFTHALESFLSNKANPFSDLFALESIRLIADSIETAYHQGERLEARERMLLGSMYGGMALSCAGTAAVHAMAYPLGGKFHITHGVANSMLLPHVLEFNLDAVAGRLQMVAAAMGMEAAESKTASAAADWVLGTIRQWTRSLDIPQNLRAYGVTEQDIPALSTAASQVTRLMANNPKPMTVEQIAAVYRKLLN